MLCSWVRALALAFAALLSGGPAFAADKVVFQLDWFPTGEKSPVYVGIQRGFFAAEGVEVALQAGRGSSDAITKIATGTADFGNAGIGALMTAAATGPVGVKAVLSIYSKPPDALFVAKGAGIESFKHIAGKTAAIATFSSSNANWPLMLTLNGLREADVKLLKVDPNALAPMLATGKVDATISWISVAPVSQAMLKQAGKELRIIPWSDYGLEGYGSCVFASDKVLKERPEVAVRFLRAFRKSIEFMLADPDGAAQDVKKTAPELDASLAAAEARAAGPLIRNEISARDELGGFDVVLLRKTWEWVAKGYNLPLDKVDPENLVDRTVLKKI